MMPPTPKRWIEKQGEKQEEVWEVQYEHRKKQKRRQKNKKRQEDKGHGTNGTRCAAIATEAPMQAEERGT